MKSQLQYNRYLKFVDSLKGQAIDGYCEVHHIVPKSLGGDNSKSNLIKLTARQHYIAHWMLWKALGGVAGRSFFMMSNFGKYGKVNSKTYDLARKDYSEQVSLQLKGKPSQCSFSAETRAKMSKAAIGKVVSAETRAKISAFQTGRKASDETKAKISASKKGKNNRGTGWQQSEETRQKIGQAQVGALNHMHGKKHSMETRMKMKQAHAKRQAYLKWLDEGNTPLPPDGE